MTELEKAAQMALEASTKAVTAMRGIYGGWRCESAIKACEDAITALTQAIATTEPDFAGAVIVGHSKHRGGWFVFEEVAEGEFTPIKGPFSSKDEAEQAMRNPHAPLIQPATTERKGEPVYMAVSAFIDGKPYNWREVSKDFYDTQEDRYRRVLYTSPQVPEDHPLMVFAIECEMGALQEHEVPLRARLAIDAARREPGHG